MSETDFDFFDSMDEDAQDEQTDEVAITHEHTTKVKPHEKRRRVEDFFEQRHMEVELAGFEDYFSFKDACINNESYD